VICPNPACGYKIGSAPLTFRPLGVGPDGRPRWGEVQMRCPACHEAFRVETAVSWEGVADRLVPVESAD